MLETSARLFRLLSLLQMHRDWSGPDLAERLGVTTRTIRNDVDRLRTLGYPIHATPGVEHWRSSSRSFRRGSPSGSTPCRPTPCRSPAPAPPCGPTSWPPSPEPAGTTSS